MRIFMVISKSCIRSFQHHDDSTSYQDIIIYLFRISKRKQNIIFFSNLSIHKHTHIWYFRMEETCMQDKFHIYMCVCVLTNCVCISRYQGQGQVILHFTVSVGCNYLCLPLIPASDTQITIYTYRFDCMKLKQVAKDVVMLVRFSRQPIMRCPRLPTRCTQHIYHVTDSTHMTAPLWGQCGTPYTNMVSLNPRACE